MIDEASQCDIPSAIPILYRAKRAVIIGDSAQLQHITSLRDDDDKIIAEKHNIFDQYIKYSYRNNSLFDLAEKCYPYDPIVLLGHYRSEAEIIKYSNANFYNKSLEIFTNTSKFNVMDRGISWEDVQGKARRLSPGNIENRVEANYVVSILLQLIDKYGSGVSYGVITPFTKQHNVITDIFREKTKGRDFSNYDITIYTAHKFQGDEKDIIIFSPVITVGLPEGTINFVDKEPNLLNVTVTRARQKLIITGDFNFAKSRTGYLGKLANYVEELGKVKGSL